MRRLPAVLVGLFMAILALPSPAQEAPSLVPPQMVPPAMPEAGAKTPVDVLAPGVHPLTRTDLEAWLDGFFPYALQRGDVAGAVVVVVKDGEVVLQKGYGHADVAARKPVDAERTLFRPGSVAKLFTWTAVMQLVEQGKLDLDTDVNTYLDFEIPPGNGDEPITLRNLLTHTSGFDEAARALIVTDPDDLISLEEGLKRWPPPRIADAGSTPSYSNYGAALAGYIVQRVSGEAFDDYVERHIFAPLGMQRSTFRQPLPERLQPLMSKGYKLGSGEPMPFEMISLAPAGALTASGADMGRFMIAHLQKGAYGAQRILRTDTATQMHGTADTRIPPLNRMLLGFYENDINGHRVITHAGDTQWFHSELNLFVDDGVGLFISVNSTGKEGAAGPIRATLFEQFGNRYFPGSTADSQVDAKTAKEHARQLAGNYIVSRRGHTSFFAALNLLGVVKVQADDDGTITIPALKDLAGQPKKWRQIAPYVWRNVAGRDRIAAKVEDGRVVRFGYDPIPFMVFERAPGWSSWILPLWLAALVALVATTLAWPLSALIRRRYGVAYGLTGFDARAHRLVRIAVALVLATMLTVAVTLGLMASGYDWASPGMDGWIVFVRVLALVVFVGGALIAAWNAWVVLRSRRKRLPKLWAVVLALSCLMVLWVAVAFRIVGFSANY